ncbi:MAG: ferritin [Candidatus Proteinoplasmatales archaeon SG8-5]|nr:MAG: ferritin [Candidatus Proteinoplasmatales archaeon SG8-5]
MLNKKVEKALSLQVNAELYSSYLYLSMSADLDSKSLPGFAHWMKIQAQEELYHAIKIYDYVLERGGSVTLDTIEKPQTSWKDPLAIFKAAYKHETKVTGMINKLVDLAIKEKDHATNNFLQWFVEEQVEEEASADEIVQQLALVKGGSGLFMLDKEMGARAPLFTFPAPGD